MALQGITDLYGQRTAGYTGAARPEAYGTTADPSHGQWGTMSGPVWAAPGWNATLIREAQDAYSGDWVAVDDTEYEPIPEGSTAELLDHTPYPPTTVTGYAGRGRYHGYELGTAPAEGPSNHAAPWPRTWLQAGRLRPDPATGIDDQWTEQEARRITRVGGYGADKPMNDAAAPVEFSRRDVYYETNGETLLEAPDNQLRYAPGAGSGPAMGNTARQYGSQQDTVQGGGGTNDYGYGQAHVQNYRQQTDGVPYNYQWLDAAERPFIPKGQATNMWGAQTLDGPDSPYGEMGDQTDYSAQTFAPAMVEGPATPYQAPPDPTMNTAGYADDGEDVWAW